MVRPCFHSQVVKTSRRLRCVRPRPKEPRRQGPLHNLLLQAEESQCSRAKAPGIIFWEMKKELGKTTPEQDKWIATLQACGMEARVVRPSDWDSVIVPVLTRRPG